MYKFWNSSKKTSQYRARDRLSWVYQHRHRATGRGRNLRNAVCRTKIWNKFILYTSPVSGPSPIKIVPHCATRGRTDRVLYQLTKPGRILPLRPHKQVDFVIIDQFTYWSMLLWSRVRSSPAFPHHWNVHRRPSLSMLCTKLGGYR